MAIALVTHGVGNSTTQNGFTTGSFNTTGANFIVLSLATSSASSGTISDSNGNTWTPLTQAVDAFSDRYIQFYYCENPIVGSGHTFSVTGTGTNPSINMSAWSGVGTSSFDVQNHNASGFSNSTTTGSVTPSSANELVITALAYDDSVAATINGGFTVTDANPQTGFGWTGQAMAYLIQTTAAAANPTWSWTNSARNVGAIATFKAGGGGATPSFTFAVTEAADTAAFTTTFVDKFALAVTEAADTAAFTTSFADRFALSVTEAADTAAFTTAFSDQFALSVTEAADTAAFTTTFADQFSLAATEAADVAAFNLGGVVSFALAVTETPDVAAFTTTVSDQFAFAVTEATDTAAFSASVSDQAALAVTETPDVAGFSASVSNQFVLAVTEAPDVAAFVGDDPVALSLAVTEAQDVAAFTTTFADQLTLTVTEGADTAAFTTTFADQLALVATEAPDVASFTTAFAGIPTFALAATETPDTAAFGLTAPLVAQDLGDGGPYVDHKRDRERYAQNKERLRAALQKARARLEGTVEGQEILAVAEAFVTGEPAPSAPPVPVSGKTILLVARALATKEMPAPQIVSALRTLQEPEREESTRRAAAFAKDEEDAITTLLLAA